MEPSVRQAAIFESARCSTANLAIEAVAGSGKSTTLIWLLSVLNGSCLFSTFGNKATADLAAKLAACPNALGRAEALSLHTWGRRSLQAALGRTIDVDDNKTRSLAIRVLGDKWHPAVGGVTALAAKGMDYVADSIDELVDVAEKHRIEAPDGWTLEKLSGFASQVMALSVKELTTISFSDMCYAPIKLGTALLRYDNILVDEFQDVGPVQAAMIRRAVAAGARLIMVGDTYQSIYAFRGVEQGGFAALKLEFQATELPLDVSYRCPARVVRLVQALVHHIRAKDGAAEGIVEQVSGGVFEAEVTVGDMVLCRVTAPLVELCFNLLREGKRSYIEGREVGKELLNFVKKFKSPNLAKLMERVEIWCGKECAKLAEAGKEGKAQAAKDKCDVVLALCSKQEIETIEDLIEFIATVFDDKVDKATGRPNDRIKTRICLSTVHKAKGAEANNVWIIRGDLMPHPMGKTPEERQQELNIAYVAMTRAKFALRFVGAVPSCVDASLVAVRQG